MEAGTYHTGSEEEKELCMWRRSNAISNREQHLKGSEHEKLHPHETQAVRSCCVMEQGTRVEKSSRTSVEGRENYAKSLGSLFLIDTKTHQKVFRQPRPFISINSTQKITIV